MYICSCNPFSDKAVKACFETAAAKGERMTVAETYRACTDGRQPTASCNQCVPTLVTMTKDHNQKIIPVVPSRDPL